jgi:hypothetical protein
LFNKPSPNQLPILRPIEFPNISSFAIPNVYTDIYSNPKSHWPTLLCAEYWPIFITHLRPNTITYLLPDTKSHEQPDETTFPVTDIYPNRNPNIRSYRFPYRNPHRHSN